MNAEFYRAEAIAAQAQIEGLPRAMRVTGPMMRATIGGLFVSMLLAVAASAFVEIPIQVGGSGIVVDSTGEMLRPSNATVAGFVEQIFVKVGDEVHPGQPLLKLHLPELANDIDKTIREFAELVDEDRRMAVLDGHDEADEQRDRDQKAASLDAQGARLETRLVWLRQREAGELSLSAKGLVSQAELLRAREETQQALDQVQSAKDQRAALFTQVSEASSRRARDKLARQLAISQKQAALDDMRRNLDERSVVRSSVEGIVAELATDLGSAVTPGQIIVNTLPKQRANDALQALIYLPLSKGKKVKVGDPALLLAASLDESDRDRIKGRVVAVSRTPATRASITRQLGSEQLFALLTKEGPVFEITAAIERDPNGADGLAWASGEGPRNFALERGTPLTAKVAVKRRSLLSLVLPAVRRLLDPDKSPFTGA
jgi:NHLM bacteriocin system secretion protein